MVIEVNDAGELTLPPELVQAAPHTRLEAERQGDALVVKQIAAEEKRLSITTLPTLPGRFVDETSTFRREDLYGDNGR